ncbi:unnamed protein product [Mycena citricolor]|uniref:Nudix hydrolase domain-containing protein n=1 Tax=Mycena citricolor TaxID=2018698 RepID=A0AAD2H326_9AGAR|nr:unnamed protein product [Mycena citricolor]
MASPPTQYSYLDLVNQCGNARIGQHSGPLPLAPTAYDAERLIPFALSPAPDAPIIGLLRPLVVDLLIREHASADPAASMWAGAQPGTARIALHARLDTPGKRTAAMHALTTRWHDAGLFAGVIGPGKWRDERYPVYKDPFGKRDYVSADSDAAFEEGNFAFEMERAACALFGIVTYGVHLSVYQENAGEDGARSVSVWVPTRARTKSTWPLFLDNTVAGGLPAGMPILECLVKECMEEASLPESLVRKHVRSVGVISYFHRTDKGWLQPEVEYLFDIAIPADADSTTFQPKPLDGEVERFDFLPRPAIDEALRAGRFKANCAVVLIDLFIRLGLVTADEEPDYFDIITRMHERFDWDRWASM